jgi:4-alpha-glucanotransferase
VSARSAETRFHPELFCETEQSGAPPDYFNPHGQLWRNPLYRWPAHRAEGFRWWIERFRRSFELADLTRVDHFRGFVAGWAIPHGATSGKHGRWRRGPGAELFDTVRSELGQLAIVVEDLGLITPAVHLLRDGLGLPGMRVLEFGFSGGPSNPNALANHTESSVVYTGTHDHDPLAAWWRTAPGLVRERVSAALREAGIDESEPEWALIRLALSSRSALAIVQMQDVLGLGSEARFNTPGTKDGNWRWRLDKEQLTAALAARLREAAVSSGR